MKPQWQCENQLEKAELKAAIKAKEKLCAAIGCERVATDLHHLDEDHSNNTPRNLAPSCKLCHNAEHDITAEMSDLKLVTRLFYEAQEQRKGARERVRAYETLGIPVPMAEQAFNDAKEYEEHLLRHIKAMLRVHPFYNAWLKHVKGIGPLLAASIMSELGSPTRFKTISSLWVYSGLGTNAGKAVRRKKGQKSNWNPTLKMTAWKVASQFVKTKDCLGRNLYDEYKAYYISKDGEEPKWQSHRRAMRRVAKDFLRCLWLAWMGCLELPVTEPWENWKPWPMPKDWI